MKIIYKLNKKFRTYGVRLDFQIRFEFLDVKHFKHLTIKFALALSQKRFFMKHKVGAIF